MNASRKTFLAVLLHPLIRYIVAWLVAVIAGASSFYIAWIAFDAPKRRGGNNGHVMIDFGGQWLLGRMLAKGLGEHLYHRNYLRQVLRESYPIEDEVPLEERNPEEQNEHEADSLMSWMVGRDDPNDPDEAIRPPVGGPLYPPVHALLMYPLGLLRPVYAYRSVQLLGVMMALVAGGAIRLLSPGRMWWPVATAGVILYPGFSTSLNLGQNSALALTILLWGWTLLARGRPVWGGIVWGLLAFKPVWAAAFFLVPLLTGRWRFCLAMLGMGLALAAATLPLVGWQSWLDWLQVGREATYVYSRDENWIFLSRDLAGIPRRWLLDFNAPAEERDSPAATVIGWVLLLVVVAVTVFLALRRRDRQAVSGPPAAFLLLGAWLSGFHFMYYDVLLTALPVALLLLEPRRYLQPIFVCIGVHAAKEISPDIAHYHEPALARSLPYSQTSLAASCRNIFVRNNATLTLIALLLITDFLFPLLRITVSVSLPEFVGRPIPMPIKFSTSLIGTPWNTFCLIGLWLWCGWLWLRTPCGGAVLTT